MMIGMKFIVLLDRVSRITDFFNVYKLGIYEKQDAWELVEYKELYAENIPLRLNIIRLVDEICSVMKTNDSNMLIGTCIVGLPYHMFNRYGINMCELDYISQDAFQKICEDFYESKQKQIGEEVLPYPIPTEENGFYVFDFDNAIKVHPNLSSKQMLIPFLERGSFVFLSILCSHVIPWLKYYVEQHNMKMYVKQESGQYVVTIVSVVIEA